MEATVTSRANNSLRGPKRPFQKLSFILAALVLMFANVQAGAANDDFPNSVTGTWAGQHCGKRSVTWVVQMLSSNAYVRERTCADGACEEADYRVSQIGTSERKFAITPHYVPKAPREQYAFSVVVQYSADGQRLDGLYVAHPYCSTIRLTKVSNDVLPPLSSRSAARLPRPVLTVSAEPPPRRPSSADRVDDSSMGRREPSYSCFDVCQPTADGKTYCQRVCD